MNNETLFFLSVVFFAWNIFGAIIAANVIEPELSRCQLIFIITFCGPAIWLVSLVAILYKLIEHIYIKFLQNIFKSFWDFLGKY